jgi:hypothetical protein
MSYLDRITFKPEQCGGRPCIRSMRIRAKDVLDLLMTFLPVRKASRRSLPATAERFMNSG